MVKIENVDMVKLAGFLLLCLFMFYGGAFLYWLVNYRLIKKYSWTQSIGSSFIWMLGYAFIGTIISDIVVSLSKTHPCIMTGIIVVVVGLPYLAAIRLFLKVRNVK